MKKVYFIGGIGADKRIFSFLNLSFCDVCHIEWLSPVAGETLEQYALRLRQHIPEPHPTIVGISFGGMLATEMAKADPNIKAIIISSNKTAGEFPPWLRIGKWLPVYNWLPASFLKKFTLLNRWIMGGKNKEQAVLLRQIIRDSDMRFTQWAIKSILYWKNQEIPPNLVHIHGTADRLLPCRRLRADHVIEGGTHVMVMEKPEAVSNLLQQLIS